jgi:hypothetical protein
MLKTATPTIRQAGIFLLFLLVLSSTAPRHLEAQPSPETVETKAPFLDDDATLSDYLAYAALQNPGLEAAFNRFLATFERIEQAEALPDPKVTYAYFIENVETRVGPQRHKLGVAQAFPWLSKLRLRGAVASEAAHAAEQHYLTMKLKLFFRVKDAYYELYYLSRAISITEDNIALLKHLESVAQANFMVGAPVSGVIKAQVELGKIDDRRVGPMGDADEDVSFSRQNGAGGELAFGKCQRELRADAHHFARRTHLGAQHDIHTAELDEREDRLFDGNSLGRGVFGEALLLERDTRHHLGRHLGRWQTSCLRNERHGAAGTWIDFNNVKSWFVFLLLHRELHVHQSNDAQVPC